MYTVNVLLRNCPWKRPAKPLHVVACRHHSASQLMSENLGTATSRMTDAAPVEDEDAHD